MSEQAVTIHIDGASRGNPGPAAYAFVINRPGVPAVEVKGCLGAMTNNVAEYTALVRALEKATELGAIKVHVYSDSELLVRQMMGVYQVKNEALKELFAEAKELCRGFRKVDFEHVPREKNKRADALCNEALDGEGKASKTASGHSGSSKKSQGPSPRLEAAQEEAILCLQSAAKAWARGNPSHPRPEDVWDQIRSILEEQGVLR